MVIATFLTIGNRGFWLPNDPRGSWSTEVWADHLRPFGPASKTNARHSVAHKPHDRALRHEAKTALKYPAVVWDVSQVEALAVGFVRAIESLGIIVHACAIMPDHVHFVFERHTSPVETLSAALRRAGGAELTRRGIHPYEELRDRKTGRVPSPWAAGDGWKVFLDAPEQVWQKIQYVEQNPMKAGLPPQNWPFVTKYGG